MKLKKNFLMSSVNFNDNQFIILLKNNYFYIGSQVSEQALYSRLCRIRPWNEK